MITDTKYILYDLATGKPVSVYMNVSAHEKMYFDSVSDARHSNCHGVYADRTKYGFKKVKIEAITDNLDEATPQEVEVKRQEEAEDAALEQEMDEKGLKGLDRYGYRLQNKVQAEMDRRLIEAISKYKDAKDL